MSDYGGFGGVTSLGTKGASGGTLQNTGIKSSMYDAYEREIRGQSRRR